MQSRAAANHVLDSFAVSREKEMLPAKCKRFSLPHMANVQEFENLGSIRFRNEEAALK